MLIEHTETNVLSFIILYSPPVVLEGILVPCVFIPNWWEPFGGRSFWCFLLLGKGLLKVRWCWIVLQWTASEGAEKKVWERTGQNSAAWRNIALGCGDRSQLSLQHLLSAGIYYLPLKPTQTDWTLATSCPLPLPPSLPPDSLLPFVAEGYRVRQLPYLHFSDFIATGCQWCQSPLTWSLDFLPSTVCHPSLGNSSRTACCRFIYTRHLSHSRPVLLIETDCPGSAVAASCNRGTQMDASHLRSCRALQ